MHAIEEGTSVEAATVRPDVSAWPETAESYDHLG